MDKKPVDVAVIGLGMASKPHLDALKLLQDQIRVSGVFNRSRERAEEVATQSGYAVFDSVEAIAADSSTQAVIVLTPPNQRLELVRTLAAAGKHILTEKPVERSTAAARQIVEFCETANVLLGVVFQHRFRAGARRLADLIRDGQLGKLALVRADIPWWRDQAYYDVPGRGTYERDGGGVLISQAIHVLDLMLSLTGPAQSVQAICTTTDLHKMEAEDFACGGIRFCSGAIGSVVATSATFPGSTESITVDGTEATAVLTGGNLKVMWRDGREEDQGEISGTGGGADPMAFPCDWHRDLIADFADAVRDHRPPAITGREALRVHALIDAMVTSSKTGQVANVSQES